MQLQNQTDISTFHILFTFKNLSRYTYIHISVLHFRAGAGKYFSLWAKLTHGPNSGQISQFKANQLALAGRMWPAGGKLSSPALEHTGKPRYSR